MTEILGVAEAVLYVDDLDLATAFYTRVLGLPLTAGFDEASFLQTGRDSTLILFNAEGIRRLGVAIEHEQTWSYGSRSIYFRDPDNNSLELITDDHYPENWRQRVERDAGD